jgi:hypothetical protein
MPNSGAKRLTYVTLVFCRFQWPSGLWRESAAARLQKLWVRILPGAWMSVCYQCCVLSGRGLCDELITRPDESYRLWCVVVFDLGTLWMRRPLPTVGCYIAKKNTLLYYISEDDQELSRNIYTCVCLFDTIICLYSIISRIFGDMKLCSDYLIFRLEIWTKEFLNHQLLASNTRHWKYGGFVSFLLTNISVFLERKITSF